MKSEPHLASVIGKRNQLNPKGHWKRNRFLPLEFDGFMWFSFNNFNSYLTYRADFKTAAVLSGRKIFQLKPFCVDPLFVEFLDFLGSDKLFQVLHVGEFRKHLFGCKNQLPRFTYIFFDSHFNFLR